MSNLHLVERDILARAEARGRSTSYPLRDAADGEALLVDARRQCLGLADKLGIHAVEVDAIDQQARGLYERYGFVPLLDNALHLYLPITTIRDGLKPG